MQTQPASDPGFKLPGENKTEPAAKSAEQAPPPHMEVAPAGEVPATDTATRDADIGSAAFLVLLVIYFFVRNAYVHHLVVKRVAPSAAGSAGWLMFVGLGFVSAAAVLAIVNASRFLTFAVTAPLVIVGVVALVAALFVGRR